MLIERSIRNSKDGVCKYFDFESLYCMSFGPENIHHLDSMFGSIKTDTSSARKETWYDGRTLVRKFFFVR